MEHLKKLIPLREYCRTNAWPRLPQWQHWIYSRNTIAQQCVKKIACRYMIDMEAFQNYLKSATLDENI
jgi:hypothetical protein